MSTSTKAACVVLALVVAGSLTVAACAAGAGAPASPHETQRNEILMLDGRILDWRREMGLEPTPRENWVQFFYAAPQKRTAAPASTQPVPELCRDTCTLADYICDAADNICRISDDLRDDDWARRKCANSKASCVEARQRCTTCTRRAAPAAPPSSSSSTSPATQTPPTLPQ